MSVAYTRALVTGATGLVGKHLCSALVQQGVTVTATSLDAAGLKNEAGIVVQAGDITDPTFIEDIVKQARPQVVFHLAAYGTFGHEQDVERMIEVNVNGTRSLLAASSTAGCKAFITAGSIKEYGVGRTPITEATLLAPWDAYAATKAAASFFGRLTATTSPMGVTTLRLSPVYGPGDTLTRFVPSAIAAAIAATPFTLTVGPLVRSFTYVDDVVAAFQSAADKKTAGYSEYNIGGPAPASFNDILAAIEVATNQKMQLVTVPPVSTHDDSWIVDSSLAGQALSWQPRTTMAEGMQRTVEWYKHDIVGHT